MVAVPIRVVIIEDVREVREGLRMLIDGTGGFQCAANFRTMEDALAGIGGTRPDVILTDIGLPGMDGIEGTRQLRERFPEVPILALTVYDDDDEGVQRDLRRRVRVPPEEHTAGAVAGITEGSDGWRRADVAGNCTARHHALSGVSAPGARILPSDATGDGVAQTDGRGAPLQDRGARDGHLHEYRLVPLETYLRKAAGPLQDGGRREGPA